MNILSKRMSYVVIVDACGLELPCYAVGISLIRLHHLRIQASGDANVKPETLGFPHCLG